MDFSHCTSSSLNLGIQRNVYLVVFYACSPQPLCACWAPVYKTSLFSSVFPWLEGKYLTKGSSSGNRRMGTASPDRLWQCATSSFWHLQRLLPGLDGRSVPSSLLLWGLLSAEIAEWEVYLFIDIFLSGASYFLAGYKLKPPNSAGKQ